MERRRRRRRRRRMRFSYRSDKLASYRNVNSFGLLHYVEEGRGKLMKSGARIEIPLGPPGVTVQRPNLL
jgi:hypothetical protein